MTNVTADVVPTVTALPNPSAAPIPFSSPAPANNATVSSPAKITDPLPSSPVTIPSDVYAPAPAASGPLVIGGNSGTVWQGLVGDAARLMASSDLQVSAAWLLNQGGIAAASKVPALNKEPLAGIEWSLSAGLVFGAQYLANAFNNVAVTNDQMLTSLPLASQAAAAIAPLNLSQQTAQTIWRDAASKGEESYNEGQAQLVANFAGTVRALAATITHNDPFATYLSQANQGQQHLLSNSTLVVPMLAAAAINLTTIKALLTQWNFLSKGERNTTDWQLRLGPLTVATPNTEAYISTTEPLLGLRTQINTGPQLPPIEIATQVGIRSGRTRQELNLGEIKPCPWLGVVPFGAIDFSGGQNVGGVVGALITLRPFATANVPYALKGLGVALGAEWSANDVMRQGVQGVPGGVSPRLGLLFAGF